MLRLEAGYRCPYDRLEVYDGMYGTERWNRTGRYCSRSRQGSVIYSSGSFMKIVFRTDQSHVGRGFVLNLRSSCGGYVTAPRGVLQSPNFSLNTNYPNNVNCQWVVKARPSRTIGFHFNEMEIAGGDSTCGQDKLILRNGGTSSAPFFLINPDQGSNQNGFLCGNRLPDDRNTTTNLLSDTVTRDLLELT